MGNDSVTGGQGSDRIVLGNGFGTDTIDGTDDAGNADLDVLDASTVTTDIVLALSASDPEAGVLGTGGNTANFDNIETVILGSGNDSVTGSSGNDSVTAGAGADTVNMGQGDDTVDLGDGSADGQQDVVILKDGFGNDVITNFDAPTPNGDGTFTGIDTLDVTGLFDLPPENSNSSPVRTNDVVVTNDGSGNALLTFPNGETIVLTGISPVAAANPFYLNAIGIPLPDGTVSGTAGDDIIDGSYMDDPDGDVIDNGDAIIADHGPQDDLIEAGAGNDIIFSGAGNDTVYAGTGDDTVFSGAGDQTIFGGAGNDSITAAGGDDSINGGSGDDTIVLNDTFGDDTIVGGETGETVGDSIDGSALTQAVTVVFTGAEDGSIDTGVDTATFSEIENLETGSGNDTVTGAAGTQNVITGAGDDTITTTGTGSDTISTGAGNDTIYFSEADSIDGGTGDDTFIFDDLEETTNGTITIVGGQDGEKPDDRDPLTLEGDTLALGTAADLSTLNITSTTINLDGNTSYAGSVVMDDGTILNFSEIENIICFTPGTCIATPRGARDVATLRIGDLVLTRDHGLRPIRWIQSRTVPAIDRFAPIRIKPGVITGQNADLLVSPQHRMLFQGYRAELLFGASEVLVAAKHLIDGNLVTQDAGGDVTYIHMMFDEHEIVYAQGAATESFHPGAIGLSAVSDPARDELFALFPALRSDIGSFGSTARRCLKQHEANLLTV